jgi:hypothetical protein
MKKRNLLLLLALLFFSHLSLNAQTNYEIECTMTVDQISLDQPYDIDDAKQEETRVIATTLLAELQVIYNKVNQNITFGLEENIETVKASVLSAQALGMNYSMFDADIEFINTLN